MLLQRAFTLGTPRRVSASSMTSSWYSEPRCTSSTDTEPVIAASAAGVGPDGGVGRAERQRGPDALAAGADEVRGDLGEERIGSLYRLVQCGLDPRPDRRRSAPGAR